MDILPEREILKRKGLIFFIARSISNWGYKNLTKAHVEFSKDILDLKEKNSVFLYSGLHRSLWETTGMLSAMDSIKLPIPLVGMGDNLIKGKLFVTLVKNASTFIVKRGNTRREIVSSAKELKRNMYSFMAYGRDVLLFPEGTRTNIPKTGKYGGFFPTSFDALLEYEKDKVANIINITGQHRFNSYIIPFNCDYSIVREDKELVGIDNNTPRTLKVWDSLKMLKHIKDVYISFGEPFKVAENLEKNRKEIAVIIREKCLDLVKILPVNIVGKALVESLDENKYDTISVHKKIETILKRLSVFSEKFRGFPDNLTPENIYSLICKSNPDFESPSPDKRLLYKLYSDYINHYLS